MIMNGDIIDLPPYNLITTTPDWQTCLYHLQIAPRLGIDVEANSMFAYRERVCLIQISTASQDFIIDPTADFDLTGLGELLANPKVEKIFHAAEYDLTLLKREYNWELNNLFDTMWAARILGYSRYGLAGLLEDLYQVKLDKRFQKSNWCERPLLTAQLTYAQLDTHYLLQLQDYLKNELHQKGHSDEAQEIFAELTHIQPNNHQFDPNSFWAINGVHELGRQEQAVVKALHIYRDQEARRRNQPLFKIFSDKTLMELVTVMPQNLHQLQRIHGMTPGQVRRYGKQILDVMADGKRETPPALPKRSKRVPEAIANRYEKLHTWRKERAQARGVESDVILGREALWTLAEANPQTMEELVATQALGPWRYQTYGAELLRLLQKK